MTEMNEVYEKRLLSLADFLEKLHPERFDFSSWVGDNYQGLPDLSCGTTACGLGWASAMPEFRALGLVLKRHNASVEKLYYPALKDDATTTASGEPLDPFYQACRATDFLFGLTTDETQLLFVPTEDEADDPGETGTNYLLDSDETGSDDRLSRRASPKRLAEHIRSFCEYKFHDL